MADTLKAPPIVYIEIWNEPDLNHFWPAGIRDFQEFFIETFLALKTEFPDLKIGGPGFHCLLDCSSTGRGGICHLSKEVRIRVQIVTSFTEFSMQTAGQNHLQEH